MDLKTMYDGANKAELLGGAIVIGIGLLMLQWMVIAVGLLLLAMGLKLVKL